jgi:PAS domain S-box-containing protein
MKNNKNNRRFGKDVVNMSSKLAKGRGPVSYEALEDKNHALQAEIQDLRARLEEAEELKRAISEGDLDALVIPGPEGELIFTLDSADRAYRVLVETMNEGTATLAFDGTILYCNRQFAGLVKTPPQNLVGTSVYRFIAPENVIKFKALLKQEAGRGEINFQAGGGTSLPAYLSVSSLKSEGSPNAWCLVVTDLTEQKKNEEVVAAERLARSIIEQAAEAIVVCDTSGRVTHFSNAVARICRCDPTFQIFENLIDIQFSEGEDAGKSILPVSSALKGFSTLGVDATFELEDCQKSHLLLNSGPLKNDEGKIVGCVVTFVDITERKQLEEKTRQRAEEVETLMEVAPVAIWIGHDPQSHDITGNRMANEFYEAEIGENVSANITPVRHFFYKGRELTADELPMQQASLKDIDVRNAEFDVLLPSGEWRALLGSASPLHDAEGRVRGSLGAFIDITGRKQAEEALRESEERYRLLFTNMSEAFFLAEIICDKDGKPYDYRYLETNPACELNSGVKKGQIVGKSHLEVFPNASSIAIEELGRVALSGKSKHFEIFSQETGKYLDIYAFSTEKGKIAVIFRDITERKRMEAALKKNEQRLNDLLSSIRDGFFELDRDWRFTYINKRAARNGGFEPEELIGESIWEKFPYMVNSKFEEEYRGVMETRLPVHFEIKSFVRDQWYEVSVYPSTSGISVFWRDVTERKWAEEELREAYERIQTQSEKLQIFNEELKTQSEELKEANEALSESEKRFRTLAENSPDIIARFDRQKRHIYANPAVAGPYGRSPEEVIGKTQSELGRYSGQLKFLEKHYENVFATGKPETVEFRYISSRGKEYYLNTKIVPEFIDGKVTSVLAISRDIKDIKEAEAKLKETLDNLENLVKERTSELENAYSSLKESERGFAEAQKMAHIGNWYRSLKTDKIYWSDEVYRIFGFKPQEFEVTYNVFLSYVHPEDRGCVNNNFKKALNGEPYSSDYRIISANGIERIVHTQGEVVFTEEKTPIVMRGTIQDITKRKRAEEALEKQDKIRIKEIHHRIKNNLQVICSLLSLEAEKFSDEKMLEAFRESRNRVTSMALIHEELYKGKGAENLDFAAYLRKLTADLFSSYNLGNNINLKLDVEQVYFGMDTAIPLGIIVNELVSNALKHAFPAGRKGEIHIDLCKKESFASKCGISGPGPNCMEKNNFHYMLTVTDDGKGIPEEIECQDADSLGLQLINILVEQIDGCIELRRDQGTKFIIWFNSIEK